MNHMTPELTKTQIDISPSDTETAFDKYIGDTSNIVENNLPINEDRVELTETYFSEEVNETGDETV